MSPSPPTALLVLLLVFAAVVCNETTHASALNATTNMGVSPQKVERIQRYLEKINKPAVKSIKSPDGDIIDCVLMNKQLAFDHPLLKNHKIQRVAPNRPALRSEAANQQPRNETASRAWQAWNHVENCPVGTVSVRRTTVEDVLRAGSLSRFLRKKVLKRIASEPYTGHEYAVAYVDQQQAYGTKAIIDVWDPSVEFSSEFSLSQIWLIAGSYENEDLNTVEVGWQRDAYASTGCYNLVCPGFVQTNNQVVLGGAITSVSTYNATQREITLLVRKDPNSGNWWLSYQNIDVGYWPAEIFTHLASYATLVEWGGEIVNDDVNGQHTTTQMGSGHFAEEGYRKASYFRNVEVVNSTNALSSPQSVSTIAGNPNCYDIQTFFNASWGSYFFYGGPGRNPECP
ncbi:uncharacterized protein LOC109727174 isoform X2 [Ananas comosus]|uniref:Uncharacterized protein LOC109727174 isoform X2 n=1 Tax=Ananas comosus TaxID=4615 RepID=A0A6P5GXZ8_ANACO|nr:uncharacterized protein LOC109727174 isoform X2 [Ananas comosus]